MRRTKGSLMETTNAQPEVLSEAQVAHVAQLARLALSPEEQQRLTVELNAILGYMAQLNEVETTGVPPTTHVLDLVNVLREDIVRPTFPVADALANAPETTQQFFVVPRIVE